MSDLLVLSKGSTMINDSCDVFNFHTNALLLFLFNEINLSFPPIFKHLMCFMCKVQLVATS